MALNNRAFGGAADSRNQARKQDGGKENPPQMNVGLAAIVAADAQLAAFTARWEPTFLEILRMNDIEKKVCEKNGTAGLFVQHRRDDLADLEYVKDYIETTYRDIALDDGAGGTTTVVELWCEWILTTCMHARRAEQRG